MTGPYTTLIQRLQAVSRRYLITGIAEAFCGAILILAAGLIVGGFVESDAYLSPVMKTVIAVTLLLAAIGAFTVYVVLRLMSKPDPAESARMVEDVYP